jgi:hypothetical protein
MTVAAGNGASPGVLRLQQRGQTHLTIGQSGIQFGPSISSPALMFGAASAANPLDIPNWGQVQAAVAGAGGPVGVPSQIQGSGYAMAAGATGIVLTGPSGPVNIRNGATPVGPLDVTNKVYVDGKFGSPPILLETVTVRTGSNVLAANLGTYVSANFAPTGIGDRVMLIGITPTGPVVSGAPSMSHELYALASGGLQVKTPRNTIAFVAPAYNVASGPAPLNNRVVRSFDKAIAEGMVNAPQARAPQLVCYINQTAVDGAVANLPGLMTLKAEMVVVGSFGGSYNHGWHGTAFWDSDQGVRGVTGYWTPNNPSGMPSASIVWTGPGISLFVHGAPDSNHQVAYGRLEAFGMFGA